MFFQIYPAEARRNSATTASRTMTAASRAPIANRKRTCAAAKKNTRPRTTSTNADTVSCSAFRHPLRKVFLFFFFLYDRTRKIYEDLVRMPIHIRRKLRGRKRKVALLMEIFSFLTRSCVKRFHCY